MYMSGQVKVFLKHSSDASQLLKNNPLNFFHRLKGKMGIFLIQEKLRKIKEIYL